MDQNVRNKLNEIRQKRLESENDLQANEPSTSSSDKPLKIVALGGVATGFIAAWLMNSFLSTENADLIAQKSRVAIYENEIREANKTIEQLNDRVDMLAKSISSLEAEPADGKPASTLATSRTPEVTDSTATRDTALIPTHVVKTRLNLRKSTSLDDAPIGVLSTGTEVRYINEEKGWYYVDTELLGKGWCASEYLSPLSSP